jgi:hypothetical protein
MNDKERKAAYKMNKLNALFTVEYKGGEPISTNDDFDVEIFFSEEEAKSAMQDHDDRESLQVVGWVRS